MNTLTDGIRRENLIAAGVGDGLLKRNWERERERRESLLDLKGNLWKLKTVGLGVG